MKEAAKDYNTDFIEQLIQRAMIYTEHCKRKTVYPSDIAAALQVKGKTVVY